MPDQALIPYPVAAGSGRTARWCRPLLLGWLLTIMVTQAAAQTSVAALRQRLRADLPDTTRIFLLKDLSFEYRGSRPDSALYYARQGRALAERIGYPKGEAMCRNTEGAAYWGMGDLSQALAAFLAANRIHEAQHDRQGMASTLGNIGRVYEEQGDHRTALRYTLRARRLYEALGEKSALALQNLNLGASYEALNQFDSALYYTQLGYAQAQHEPVGQNRLVSTANLGTLYQDQKKPALAVRQYRLAIPLARQLGNPEFLSIIYQNLADSFRDLHLPDSTRRYAALALATAHRTGLNQQQLTACQSLADYYAAHHQPDSVVRYLRLAATARDSLYNEDKTASVQRLMFAENIRQQERQAAEAQAQAARVYNLQLLAIAIFILTLLAGLLLLNRRLARTRVAGVLGVVALLMVFEFIALLADPTIQNLTNNSPILTLLAMMVIASGLAPLHHRMEGWVRQRYAPTAAADPE